MPIKKSAFKALRQAKKRELRNRKVKIDIKWLRRQFLKAVAAKDKKSGADFYFKLQKALDRAAQKGILKKNTVARYKSRLSKKLKQI